MNTLPRRILGYLTPRESFAKFVGCVAWVTHPTNYRKTLCSGFKKSVSFNVVIKDFEAKLYSKYELCIHMVLPSNLPRYHVLFPTFSVR